VLIIIVRFVVKQQYLSAFNARMRQQAQETLAREPGCNRFDIGSDASDPCKILLYEIYDDAAAFDAHLVSAQFQSFNIETQDWVESKVVERWDGPWE
jgi:quinol monooxygenase YgiN